ncbi:MAG: hypothetical protein WCE23_07445 [Candidatus Binatus sp.]|uniref:hypothetical protein n=1 Tax=Candidatus Binatus sp. TaxID=2811406 RepID=UPI003C7737F4
MNLKILHWCSNGRTRQRSGALILRTVATLLILRAVAAAQNLPPPGAYQPIPNFTGVGAGLQFREAINDRFSGAQQIAPSIASTAFANLPPEQDGMLLFCNNCRSATPCVSGGGGAWALGTRGQWACASAALEANLNANGNKVSSLAGATVNGDALAFGQTGAQLNTLSGSKLNGTDAITNVSLNGVLNAQDFGAVCSDTTESATTTASNATVTVGAIGDFKVGQYVKLDAAGASNTIATPTIASVTDDGYSFPPQRGADHAPFVVFDIPALGAATTANGFCNVDLGTANNSNTSCSTTYGYSVQNVGQTGIGAGLNGMRSAASATVYITNAPSGLSIGNAVIVTYSTDANTTGTIIRRCTGASCTPTSIYAVVTSYHWSTGQTSVSYRDNGKPYGIDEEASTSAVAADLDAQITAISGSSVTLSVAPSQSGTHTMRHDNAPALQQAVNASVLAGITGSKVQLPACAIHYDMSQAVSFWQLSQTGISGPGSNFEGIANANIRWDGPAGGIVFNMNNAFADTIEGIGLDGLNGSTPGVMIEMDGYGTSSPSTQGPGAPNSGVAWAGLPATGLQVRNVNCGVVGLCVGFGGGPGNEEDAVIDGLNCSTPNGVGGNVCIYSNSQETYNEAIYNTTCSSRDYCFYYERIGSFVMMNTNSENAGILFEAMGTSNYGRVIGGQEEGAQLFEYGGGGASGGGQMLFSDFRIAGGSGPWDAVVWGGGATYENISEDTVGSPTTSMNWIMDNNPALFINVYFGSGPLSFLGKNDYWTGLPFVVTPGGDPPASPYSIPITTYAGNGIPNFTCIHCAVNGGPSMPGVVSNEVNQATSFNTAPAATTLTGTAGTAVCSQSMQGTLKIATCYLNAYQETGTAQTVCFNGSGCTANLAGVNFSAAPNILASCGTYGPTSSATVLTLPANAGMTAETCNITAIGQ